MEIIDTKNSDKKYVKATKRVEELKEFYQHVTTYIIVNLALNGFRMIRNINFDIDLGEIISGFNVGSLWFWWGIGLVIHAMKVFGYDFLFGKNWEEKKLNKLMTEEDERSKRF